MTFTDDLDDSVSLQVQLCRCCWIYYQQLSGCYIQFILSVQIQHPSHLYGAPNAIKYFVPYRPAGCKNEVQIQFLNVWFTKLRTRYGWVYLDQYKISMDMLGFCRKEKQTENTAEILTFIYIPVVQWFVFTNQKMEMTSW